MARPLLRLSLASSLVLALAVGCGADDDGEAKAGPGSEEAGGDDGTAADGCDAAADTDGDGLDDCAEEALGTSPEAADTDGDGLTDSEELDCVSDPLDGDERCYACGWAHGDPGTLTASGAELGDTMANLQMVDQCGETVELWDFAGSYTVLFMTAAWCPNCKDEAAGLADAAAVLAADAGQPVQGLILLFEGRTAGVPTEDDVVPYAADIGADTTPVLGDVASQVLDAVPYDGRALPGVCLLSPDMVLLTCGSGEGQVPTLTAAILDHAG